MSAALPDRLALLGEGDRALARVLGGEHRAGDLALLRPRTPRSVQSRCCWRTCLVAASASGAFLAIAAASSSARVERLARLGEAVDEPELVAALGGDRVAGQRQLHRHAVGHPLRQAQQRAAGGDERALDLRDAELRARGGDDQVAGQRDLEARRRRRSPRSRRSAACARRAATMPAKPRSPTHGRSPVTNALRSMPAQKPLPAPVRTPTWRSSSSSSSSSAAAMPSATRAVDGVARVGPVERDEQDAVAALGEDSLIGHARSLRAPVGFRPLAATHWT